MTNGNVPVLGPKPKVKMGVTPMAFVRQLDEKGTVEGTLVTDPAGNPAVELARDAYMDATELEAMIRRVVREELFQYHEYSSP